MSTVFEITKEKISQLEYPDFRVGDVVKVSRRVKEGSKERVQIIEGVIIAHKHGFQPGATITLRRVTLGVAVELVLPLFSPHTEDIKILKRQKTRKAKLYHLRMSKGKKSKLKENIEGTKQVRKQEEEKIKAKAAEKKDAEIKEMPEDKQKKDGQKDKVDEG